MDGEHRSEEDEPDAERPLPGPGWFPDVHRDGWLRWWDGAHWTEHRVPDPSRPESPPATTPSGRPTRSWAGNGWFMGALLVAAIWILFSIGSTVVGVVDRGKADSAKGFGGEQKRVADVIDGFQRAFAHNRGASACRQLMTADFARAVERGSGSNCPEVVDDAVHDAQVQPDIKVSAIRLAGPSATATLREGDDHETWRFALVDGAWRVAAIAKT